MCPKRFLSSAGLGYSSVMECLLSNVNGPRFNPQNWERKGEGEMFIHNRISNIGRKWKESKRFDEWMSARCYTYTMGY